MFNKRLMNVRQEKGLTRRDVAKYLNVSESTYGKWELGKRNPDIETIATLANFFKVSTDYLLGNDVNVEKAAISKTSWVRIPVYGTIPAGVPMEAIQNIVDYEDIPSDWCKGDKEYFALKIKGDSMVPKYIDEDIIILLKTLR